MHMISLKYQGIQYRFPVFAPMGQNQQHSVAHQAWNRIAYRDQITSNSQISCGIPHIMWVQKNGNYQIQSELFIQEHFDLSRLHLNLHVDGQNKKRT